MKAIYELARDNNEDIFISHGDNECYPHFHRHIECLYLHEQSLDVTIDEHAFILEPGQFCIADSYEIHAYQNENERPISTVLIIPARYLADYNRYKDEKKLSVPYVTDPMQTKRLYDYMLRIEKHLHCNELIKQGCMDEFLGAVLDTIPLSGEKKKSSIPIRELLLYLEQNYREEIRLEQIASHFGYSKYHFSRMFHQYFKCSLNEYINRLRIAEIIRAQKQNPDEKLFTIILDAGFSSIQTFYRCFRKFYGRAPLEYLSEIDIPPDSISPSHNKSK